MALTKVRGGGLDNPLTLGGGAASDTSIIFDGNAVDYHIGLDDSADKLTIGKGTALGTTTSLTIDENGIITKPLQPGFCVKPNAQQNNMAAGNSQVVMQFNNEKFDTNGDYDTSNYRFTAPVDGIYQFNLVCRLDSLDGASNYYSIFLTLPGSDFVTFLFDPDTSRNDSNSDLDYFPAVIAIAIDMDANDTVDARFQQYSGTVQTDLITDSFFSGFLVG